jgi:hypothetical protein
MCFGIALGILLVVSRFWRRFGAPNRWHQVRGVILGGVALALPDTLFTMGHRREFTERSNRHVPVAGVNTGEVSNK